MKYYTIEIVTKDGVTSQAIFERADIDVAKKEFHNTLSYNINLEGVKKVSVAIVNEELSILMKETWGAPVLEPEPEPTPEPTEPTPESTEPTEVETTTEEEVPVTE